VIERSWTLRAALSHPSYLSETSASGTTVLTVNIVGFSIANLRNISTEVEMGRTASGHALSWSVPDTFLFLGTRLEIPKSATPRRGHRTAHANFRARVAARREQITPIG
jgi:hypothetical protein